MDIFCVACIIFGVIAILALITDGRCFNFLINPIIYKKLIKTSTNPVINFESFKEYYNRYPERWSYTRSNVFIKGFPVIQPWVLCYTLKNGKAQDIYFQNYKEMRKFVKFLIERKEEEKFNLKHKYTEEVLEDLNQE